MDSFEVAAFIALRVWVSDLTRCSKWREAKMESGVAIPLEIKREIERFHIGFEAGDVGSIRADVHVCQAAARAFICFRKEEELDVSGRGNAKECIQ